MNHAILLGDSILDNGAYVSGGSPVVEQLRARLPRDWRVTLLARDGAVAADVERQLQSLPDDATHLIISAGGNDALESTPYVNSPDPDSAVLLADLVEVQTRFRASYRHMIETVQRRRLPVIAGTIYDSIPGLSPIERMALSLFNDVILREIIAEGLVAIDLRRVCNESRDYADISPIEPSEVGGSKIARALQTILVSHDFSRVESVVYP